MTYDGIKSGSAVDSAGATTSSSVDKLGGVAGPAIGSKSKRSEKDAQLSSVAKTTDRSETTEHSSQSVKQTASASNEKKNVAQPSPARQKLALAEAEFERLQERYVRDITLLEKLVKDQRRANAKHTITVASQGGAFAKLEDENNQLKQRIHELDGHAQEWIRRIRELDEHVRGNEDTINQLRLGLDVQEQELGQYLQEINRLRDENAQLVSHLKQRAARIEDQDLLIEFLEGQISDETAAAGNDSNGEDAATKENPSGALRGKRQGLGLRRMLGSRRDVA